MVGDAFALLFCNRLLDEGAKVTLDRWEAYLSNPATMPGPQASGPVEGFKRLFLLAFTVVPTNEFCFLTEKI